MLAEPEGHLEVLGPLPQILATVPQCRTLLLYLFQVVVSVEEHVEGLGHDLVHIDQLLVQLV